MHRRTTHKKTGPRASSAATPAWPGPRAPGSRSPTASPAGFEAGCFGAAGYDDTSDLPDGALRASLGCGNPVAVAALHPGETVLDLGSGGGIDVLLSARRVAPGGKAYGLDGSPDMIALARENAAPAGVTNAEFLHGRIEDIPLPDGQRRRRHLQLRDQPVRRQAPRAGRDLPRAAPRRPHRHQRRHRRRGPRPGPAGRGRAADRLRRRDPHRRRLPPPAARRRVHQHHHHRHQRRRARPALRDHPGHPARRPRRASSSGP